MTSKMHLFTVREILLVTQTYRPESKLKVSFCMKNIRHTILYNIIALLFVA